MDKLTLTSFAGGLISAYDPADAPPESAVVAVDVEVEKTGRLRGRAADVETYVGDGVVAAFPVDVPVVGGAEGAVVGFDLAADEVVYYGPFDGSTAPDTFGVTDGYGYGLGAHPTGIVLPPARSASFFVAVPAPYWLGPFGHAQFADAADPTLNLVQGVIDTHAGNSDPGSVQASFSAVTAGSGENFEGDTRYYYALAFVWDGFQETALYELGSVYDADAWDSAALTLTYHDPAAQPDHYRRISHVNVYRAHAAGALTATVDDEPDTPYRLIMTIDMEDATWGTSGANRTHVLTDDGLLPGTTYEESSGIAETLQSAYVRYALAAVEGERLFVADCAHPEVEHASRYVFASLPYRYGVFDWSRDYVVLPEKPVRLVAFGGRVWALAKRAVHRISPALAYEGADDGVGCMAATACAVGPTGFLFADAQGVYFHDGRSAVRVSEDIDTSESLDDGWREGSHGSGPWVAYHRRLGVFVVVYEKDASPTYAGFVYDPAGRTGDGRRGRWDAFSVPTTAVHGIFEGPDDEVYLSVGAGGTRSLRRLFGGPSRVAWTWTTPVFDLKAGGGATGTGTSGRSKLFRLEVAGPDLDALAAEYVYDGGGSFEALTLEEALDGSFVADFPLVSGKRPVESRVQLRLTGGAFTVVSAVSLYHRPLMARALEAL